jgi:hypothetical protein
VRNPVLVGQAKSLIGGLASGRGRGDAWAYSIEVQPTTQRYLHHKPRREDAAALAEAFSASGQPEPVLKVET